MSPGDGRRIRTYHELAPSESGLPGQIAAQQTRVDAALGGVRWIVAVASGKGGVGKSLVSAALATRLAREGLRVG
ncbi:MAG: P-loop NTPase, partial [Gemmatimonadota bacterium]